MNGVKLTNHEAIYSRAHNTFDIPNDIEIVCVLRYVRARASWETIYKKYDIDKISLSIDDVFYVDRFPTLCVADLRPFLVYLMDFPEKYFPGNGTKKACPGPGRDGKRDKHFGHISASISHFSVRDCSIMQTWMRKDT